MQLLHVNTEKDAELLNELIKKTNHVFVLIYIDIDNVGILSSTFNA